MKASLFKIVFSAVLLLTLSIEISFSQEEAEQSNTFADAGADFVSAYIWRGIPFDNSPNFQGWGLLGYKNFMIGGWGSVSFNGAYFEPNLWMSYSIKNLSLLITDVDAGFGHDFFNYKSDETDHILDASLSYQFPEKFPLKVIGSVIFYGFDKKITGYDPVTAEPLLGDNDNYSGYFEMVYPTKINTLELEFTCGMATHESLVYGTKGFAIINAGIKVSKELKINDKFSLPIKFAFIANPDSKRVFTVFSISI